MKLKLSFLILCALGAFLLVHAGDTPSHGGKKLNAAGRIEYEDYPEALAQVVIISKQVVNDYQCIPTPGNPPSGNVRVYCDSGTGQFTCKTSNGASCISGGTATPSGANTNIQYNDSGAFGGDDNLTWDKTTRSFIAFGAASAVSGIIAGATSSNVVVVSGAPQGGQGYSSALIAGETGAKALLFADSDIILESVTGSVQVGQQSTVSGVFDFVGLTSGDAKLGVAAVAGTPNRVNLPITTGTSGQFLKTDGGNPQQTSWGLLAQSGAVHSTGNTAAISTATLCAASAGACNVAGQYHVHWNFIETGTACGTPTPGGVTFTLTWTDTNTTVHTIQLPMDDSASLTATSGTFTFRTTLAAAWASGDINVSTNGSIIQYATGYTACGVGTGTYQLDAAVTRLQ